MENIVEDYVGNSKFCITENLYSQKENQRIGITEIQFIDF